MFFEANSKNCSAPETWVTHLFGTRVIAQTDTIHGPVRFLTYVLLVLYFYSPTVDDRKSIDTPWRWRSHGNVAWWNSSPSSQKTLLRMALAESFRRRRTSGASYGRWARWRALAWCSTRGLYCCKRTWWSQSSPTSMWRTPGYVCTIWFVACELTQ